jgi:hypothetical protein
MKNLIQITVKDLKRFSIHSFVTLILISFFTTSLFSQINPQPRPPLLLGQSVVTSHTFNDSDMAYKVVRVIDIRNRPPFVPGGNYWSSVSEYAGTDWTKERMKNVYGIALDNSIPPNIFISSSPVNGFMSLNDSVLIYKIDGTTWNVSNYVMRSLTAGPPQIGVNKIPNISGVSMGNLCYDNQHNQIFATNFEDGKIYRIGANGVVLSTLDPFLLDDGSYGGAAIGERLFGIGTYGTNSGNVKVYFGRWNSNSNQNGQNEIWSISLDISGDFITNSLVTTPDITLPHLLSGQYSNPVADIEFSFKGDMLLGERTMYGFSTGAHQSRILEYKRLSNGSYNTYKIIRVGHDDGINFFSTNSAGGVDFDFGFSDSISNVNTLCDSMIVGTGDLLHPTSSGYVYGVQVTERSKGDLSSFKDNSHFIDINGTFNTSDKTRQGDIDVYRKDLCSNSYIDTNCISLVSDTTYCDSSGTYIYEFIVHNNSPTKTVEQLEITVDSPKPPNYVVTMPSTLNVTIPPSGTSATQRVKLVGPGAIARTEVCYTLSAQYVNDDCPWCCYIENCIKLPDCGACVEVISDSLYCSNNNYFYNFLLENGTIYNVTKIQLTSPGSDPITFVPQIIHFATPIAPGQVFPSETVQILGGYAGLTVPIRIKLFSDDFECCYIELSHTFPACDTLKTGINGNELNIDEYKLGQNYPNPFNPTTNISFSVPEESNVELSIFDISGRLVQNIINNAKYVQGVYSVKFDGSNLPSGMYYYRLKTKDYIETRKMVLMK